MAYRLSPTGVTIDGNTQLVINKNPGVADMTGYILRTDASGVASWASPASLGIGGGGGAPGTSGTSGQAGTSGTSGFVGTSGTSGISGASGQSSTSGTSGTSGQAGTSGTSGIPTGGSANQILYKLDSTNYNASWTNQGGGSLPYFINEARCIYVDPVYGNDGFGESPLFITADYTSYPLNGRNKYDRSKPYKNFNIAATVAVDGDCIVLFPGTHSSTPSLTLPGGAGYFMVYAMLGAVLTNPLETPAGQNKPVHLWKFFGFARFYNCPALKINRSGEGINYTSGGTYNIDMEFDRIENTTGADIRAMVFEDYNGNHTLNIRCSKIVSGQGIHFYSYNGNGVDLTRDESVGATYSVTINISTEFYTTQGYNLALFGWDLAPVPLRGRARAPMQGHILVDCPLIETGGNLPILRTSLTATASATASFKMDINSSYIKMGYTYSSTSSWPDDSNETIKSVIEFEGGDNINIRGEIIAGSNSVVKIRNTVYGWNGDQATGEYENGGAGNAGAPVPHYGTLTLTGNIYSDIEIVKMGHLINTGKGGGNGWQSVIIKDSYVRSRGLGSSKSLFARGAQWDPLAGGSPGKLHVINSTLHNVNLIPYPDSSGSSIILDRLSPDVGDNNNFTLYNCIALIEGSIEGGPLGKLAITTQASKLITVHNTITRQPLGTGVTDVISPTGVFEHNDLRIPRPNLLSHNPDY
jgi:hypothetical protein